MENKQPKPNPNNLPLVVSKKTNILYIFNGEKEDDKYEFTNLRTGESGILNKEQSQALFNVPLTINEMVLKYPTLISMFKTFKGEVKIEKDGRVRYYKV